MPNPNISVMRQVDPVPGKQLTRMERDRIAAARHEGEQPPAGPRPRRKLEPTMRKQAGRRYGPAPRFEPPKHAYTAPMSDERRAAIYGLTVVEVMVDGKAVQRPTGGTARQRRQWTRMHRRNLGRGAA